MLPTGGHFKYLLLGIYLPKDSKERCITNNSVNKVNLYPIILIQEVLSLLESHSILFRELHYSNQVDQNDVHHVGC